MSYDRSWIQRGEDRGDGSIALRVDDNHYTGVVWRVANGKSEKKIAAEEANHE